MFVRVAIAIPSPKDLYLRRPGKPLLLAVAVGKRVLVPFGNRRVTGFILEVLDETVCDQTVKEILDLPDPEPLFNPEDLAFYEWISRYYLHPLGKGPGGNPPRRDLRAERPVALRRSRQSRERRIPISRRGRRRSLSSVARFPEGIPLSRLRRTLGKNDVYGDLRFLETAGMIVSEERLNRPAVRPKTEKWVGLTAEIPARNAPHGPAVRPGRFSQGARRDADRELA